MMESDNGNNGHGQVTEALKKLTGKGANINIFFLDLGPEVRAEIRELKAALKDLAEGNLDKTITRKIVRNAFSMGGKGVAPANGDPRPPADSDLSLLSPKERQLLTTHAWSAEDLVTALTLCQWDRKETALRFKRNYQSMRVSILRNHIKPPSGEWPRGRLDNDRRGGWRKKLRTELPATVRKDPTPV